MAEPSRSGWMRRLSYRGVSAAIHQPRLLRSFARLVQNNPSLRGMLRVAAGRDDVTGVFLRPQAFSSTSHRPNLVAGEFAIGMESGVRHGCERALLETRLQPPQDFADRAAQESSRRLAVLLQRDTKRFDLVDDYMAPIVWHAMTGGFHGALPALPPGDPMLLNLRYVGAHLIDGPVATDEVQRRAMRSADDLNAWVRSHLNGLQAAWGLPAASDRELVARNAVGMLWVGHPATVQAGALMMQELLARPVVHRALAKRVASTPKPWECGAIRKELQDHVLELLRFRPPFPILTRAVPRDTFFGADGKPKARAGKGLTVMPIGALFDGQATENPDDYLPGRAFHKDANDRYLMFGFGTRQCIAGRQVVDTLVSALIGLLQVPGLAWADPWWRRVRYDGPIITSARLSFDA